MVHKLIFTSLIFSSLFTIHSREIITAENSIEEDKSSKSHSNKVTDTVQKVMVPANTTQSQLMNSGEAVKVTNSTQKQLKGVKDMSTFCQSFQSCYECVNNLMHPCYWCHNFGCTDQADTLCPETIAKLNSSNMNTDYVCPYITHDGAILVPAGKRTNLQVKLHVLDPVIYDKEIICQIHFKESLTHLKGLILNDIVYCYPVILQTTDRGETNTGNLKIIWGGVEPISNGIPVSVYDCENLAEDCTDCSMIAVEYGCGWCDKIKKCVIADKCGNSMIKWTLTRMECNPYDRQLLYI